MNAQWALELLRSAFRAGVEAAQPGPGLRRLLPSAPNGRLVVVGAGKAAAAMAQVVERHYRDIPLEGLVITRYGHSLPTSRIEVIEAAHPVPDEAGIRATRRLLGLLEGLAPEDLVLCLLSGGGSALLVAPDGVSLGQKAALTRELLRSGASIQEMNAVRKHLSRVKGGRLAAAAAPARVITYGDALAILDRYRLHGAEARDHLEAGFRGEVEETPKVGHPAFARAESHLIGRGQTSLEAAAAVLRGQGVEAHILSSTVTGEAAEVGKVHAAIARQVLEHGEPFTAPCAFLSGGETTVAVRGQGRGGRNGEFALGFALALPPNDRIFALAADTDGIDGSEDNAGVLVSPELLRRVPRHVALRKLQGNDSWAVFAEAGHLLVTGPTHTNVNDLRIVLVL